MRLERVKRWQWAVISVVVGLLLAQARRADRNSLPARLGEGISDQRWFEQELLRHVALADGSSIRAFDRLTVYPMSDGNGSPLHLVAGMYLARVDQHVGSADAATPPIGKLRPYFFISPVPYQPVADRQAGRPPVPAATVLDYLDSLKGKGITYTYAWWADVRYLTAAWIGGSFVIIGLLWPTAVNLLAYGSFRAPREEKRLGLWQVKSPLATSQRPPSVASGAASFSDGLGLSAASIDPPLSHSVPAPPVATTPGAAVKVLTAEPVVAPGPIAECEHREFGADRDDFYPTELKAKRT